MKEIIIYDLETIPTTYNLTPALQNKLEQKLKKHLQYSPDADEEGAKKMLMATTPWMAQVIAIGIKEVSNRFPNGEETSIIAPTKEDAFGKPVPDEKLLIKAWWDYNIGFTGTWVGFNNLNFDAYMLIIRSMYHKVLVPNKNFLNLKMYQAWPHYDIMQHLANWRFDGKVSLDLACEFFGIASPKTGEIKADTVLKAYNEGNMQGIADYCMEDVRATWELYEITRHYLK